jgi:uncharacterized protein YbjQ (UPF0145 family)
MPETLKMTTQDHFADFEIIRTYEMVRGNTVRSRHLGKDIMAALRGIVGGEVPEYTKMLAEAREQATDRMTERALQYGANAIVGVRYTMSTIGTNAAEVLAFGTAVFIRPKSLPQ